MFLAVSHLIIQRYQIAFHSSPVFKHSYNTRLFFSLRYVRERIYRIFNCPSP